MKEDAQQQIKKTRMRKWWKRQEHQSLLNTDGMMVPRGIRGQMSEGS